jgi:hypothetical protein
MSEYEIFKITMVVGCEAYEHGRRVTFPDFDVLCYKELPSES